MPGIIEVRQSMGKFQLPEDARRLRVVTFSVVLPASSYASPEGQVGAGRLSPRRPAPRRRRPRRLRLRCQALRVYIERTIRRRAVPETDLTNEWFFEETAQPSPRNAVAKPWAAAALPCMAYGTTMQAITLLHHLMDTGHLEHPLLVVVPASVLYTCGGGRFTC